MCKVERWTFFLLRSFLFLFLNIWTLWFWRCISPSPIWKAVDFDFNLFFSFSSLSRHLEKKKLMSEPFRAIHGGCEKFFFFTHSGKPHPDYSHQATCCSKRGFQKRAVGQNGQGEMVHEWQNSAPRLKKWNARNHLLISTIGSHFFCGTPRKRFSWLNTHVYTDLDTIQQPIICIRGPSHIFSPILNWHSIGTLLLRACLKSALSPYLCGGISRWNDGSVVYIPGYPKKKHLVTNSSWLRQLKMNKYK